MSPYKKPPNITMNTNQLIISEFLAKQKDPSTQQHLHALADYAKSECEHILETLHIKAVVTSRTKNHDSLSTKLHSLLQSDPTFTDWLANGKPLTDYPEMGDLAGIRIGVYFPGDVAKVMKEVEARCEVKHLFGTVTGGRDVVHSGRRNLDVTKHANGPWESSDRDGSPEYWEHYGYKSWQVVVGWDRPPPQVKGLGYAPRVEIQIGTVVTQAWAEIQHNVIYKRPDDILSTPAMKGMIDAINGLTITTEIMLRELDRSLEMAKKEAAAREVESAG